MTDDYLPTSDFLRDFIAERVPPTGGQLSRGDLARLIALTADEDASNRDWAALLLSQQDVDTPQVRAALLRAAQDENEAVAAEAILGIAQRDRGLALPLVRAALSKCAAAPAIFEAADLLANPTLIDSLRAFTEPSDNEYADRAALAALRACEAAKV